MRTSEILHRSRLVDAAMGRIPCDLTIQHIRLVNVLTGEIYPAEVDILDGVIVRVREEGQPAPLPARQTMNGGGRYLYPGFIDAHIHVESTMMVPQQAARAIVPWGTTTICTDPHEIGNVMGIEGIQFMLDDSGHAALRQYVLAPSCVPSVPALESTGASFHADDIARLLDMPQVVGIAEIMDYVGVTNNDPRMVSILEEGRKRRMFLQGHAPQAGGSLLAAYRIGGPVSDHESGSAHEVREKLRQGMHVNLRASSIVDCLEDLAQGLQGLAFTDQVSICTDDLHASDLMQHGHINAIVARLIRSGMDPVQVIRMATLNAAKEYGFDDLGAIAPGYIADFQLSDHLDGGQPYAVFIRGQMVAKEGVYLPREDTSIAPMPNTMQVSHISGPDDFLMAAPDHRRQADVQVMVNVGPGLYRKGHWMTLPIQDGHVSVDEHPDLQFISVVNRFGSGGKVIAVTQDFGLKEGAIASTVSHDSHNFTVVYRDPLSAWTCLKALCKSGGGLCAAVGDQVLDLLPLPVAGLMSPECCQTLAPKISHIEQIMQALCTKPFSLLNLSVYTLPCVPGLVITDKGLVDSTTQTFIPTMK